MEHNRLIIKAEWLDDWKLVNNKDESFNFGGCQRKNEFQ